MLVVHLFKTDKKSEQMTTLVGLTSSTHWIANKIAISSVVNTDT